MSDELKKVIEKGPELKLETEPETETPSVIEADASVLAELKELETYPVEPVASSQINIDEKQFSEAEQKMIDDFVEKIDITNNNAIVQYGVGAQKKLADFSEKALQNVRTKDLGEVGNMLSSVVVELRQFDPNNDKGGFLSFFNKGKNKIESLKARYDKVEVNVDKIADMLEKHQITLMKDTTMLEQMYDLNETYFKELSMYIVAGKKKLQKIYDEDLAQLRAKAQETKRSEDIQAAKDLSAYCDRFDKKLYDLQLSRMVSIQTAPQLRLLQNNNTLMVEKIQSTLMNTIPLWKNQMVIALGLDHATQAAKAQREVSQATNQLLTNNAEALHTATVETAKESERGIVDIETLQHTNEKLIQTFDEVMQIQQEGREKRAKAEQELRVIEDELKQKILEMAQK